jgi:hypothetical protein
MQMGLRENGIGDIDRMVKAIMEGTNIFLHDSGILWLSVACSSISYQVRVLSSVSSSSWNIKGERYHFTEAPSGDILSSLVNVPEGKQAYPSCLHTVAILILIRMLTKVGSVTTVANYTSSKCCQRLSSGCA